MNILIVSTSPRKCFSTSMYFSKTLKLFLAGHHVEVISLKSVRDYNNIRNRLADIDTLVFATPVYVDSIPSTTLEYLQKLEQCIACEAYKFNVYAITNCGFYEGHQCQFALKTYELWCEQAGVRFLGGIGIGSGVMLGFIRVLPLIGLAITAAELIVHTVILYSTSVFSFQALFQGFFPLNLIIQTVLWLLFTLGAFINIFKLRMSIAQKRNHFYRYTTVWLCPRVLFVFMASFYWVLRALFMHGVLPWGLFRRDSDFCKTK